MKKILLVSLFMLPLIAKGQDYSKYFINPPKALSEVAECTALPHTDVTRFYEWLEASKHTDLIGHFTIQEDSVFSTDITIALDTIQYSPQTYSLSISEGQVFITGGDNASLYYAKLTLLQLLSYSLKEGKSFPCLTITDYPDFEKRGFMLDISRDKVPTMTSLFKLIDELSSWKINELQLYTEHTFAYKNHKTVWENTGALTPEEIQALVAYCRKRHIDLVPNQNSFGHMENWLMHDEYLNLAECPTDCETIWGKRNRTSLNATNPAALELMYELYTELLPNFSSNYFNIGGDETVELCEGKSKAVCDSLGKGRVYIDYLKKLNTKANELGVKAQFWGDIILHHPELISELPQDMTALVWGYSDEHAFNEELPKFKEAGLDFYVCPGTSTWRSLVGRNKNAFSNLKNAALEGKKNGAKGYLNTDWGDHGHWQPRSVSYPATILGASYAWNYDSTAVDHLEFQLNHYIFNDSTGNAGKALLILGASHLETKMPNGNANAYYQLLRRHAWTMEGNYQTKELTVEGLKAASAAIDSALQILGLAEIGTLDAQIVKDELVQASNIAKHSLKLGIARLNAPETATRNIDAVTKQRLIRELEQLIQKHQEIWIKRNRVGGLDRSTKKLQEILDYYNN